MHGHTCLELDQNAFGMQVLRHRFVIGQSRVEERISPNAAQSVDGAVPGGHIQPRAHAAPCGIVGFGVLPHVHEYIADDFLRARV